MEKIIIVAVSENNVIGKDGDIPWYFPEDMKHFKELTTGNPVIMGRKTFQSLPDDFRPLPDRRNIVLTRSGFEAEGIETASSLEDAYKIAGENSDKAFIIGGSTIYRLGLEDADRIEMTRIHEEYEGDTYFPEMDEETWEEVERDEREDLSFVTYSRS